MSRTTKVLIAVMDRVAYWLLRDVTSARDPHTQSSAT
jgi:hypothetical protein